MFYIFINYFRTAKVSLKQRTTATTCSLCFLLLICFSCFEAGSQVEHQASVSSLVAVSPPASASHVLGWQLCVTTARLFPSRLTANRNLGSEITNTFPRVQEIVATGPMLAAG